MPSTEETDLHLGIKEDIAELRGEIHALRWTMIAVGVGLAALNLILKFLG